MEIWLIRHGETEWTISKAHTGRCDISMTDRGRETAIALGKYLAGRTFQLVLVSPLKRAMETCKLAGYANQAITNADLCEWDYGDYEGKTPDEIRALVPDWSIWDHGVSNGETLDQVAARARRVLEIAGSAGGDSALFAHGHLLRILASCWLGLPPNTGQYFALDTACISVLGFERGRRVIRKWNVEV